MNKILIPVMLMAALTLLTSVGVTNTVSASKSDGIKTATIEGVTFEYPRSWDLEEKKNRFTSIIATLEYNSGGKWAQIAIERDEAFSGSSIDTLKTLVPLVYEDASIFESGSDKYTVNNQSAPYVIATYTAENLFGFEKSYVVMGVAIELGNGDGAFVQYRATEDDFDKLLGNAEQIIQSIKLVDVETPV